MQEQLVGADSNPVVVLANQLDPIFQIITGLFVIAITVITARHSQRVARLHALQTMVDSWMRFDTLLLTDAAAMDAYNEISGTQPDEKFRVDWIVYYYINQAYHAFLAHSYGGVQRKYLNFELDTVWRNIDHSADRVKLILAEGGYPSEFVRYFIKHHKNWLARKS